VILYSKGDLLREQGKKSTSLLLVKEGFCDAQLVCTPNQQRIR
jgi:hypothetical protein